MKVFVDLRLQHSVCCRFAWYCTSTDTFETHGGEMSWNTWAEFQEACDEDGMAPENAERYRGLTEPWAFLDGPALYDAFEENLELVNDVLFERVSNAGYAEACTQNGVKSGIWLTKALKCFRSKEGD